MLNQEKTKKPIIKEAIAHYPKAFSGMSLWLFNFLFILIIICALGFLSTYTFFITIPFLLIPFFFALQQTGNYIRFKNDFDNSKFKGFVKLYYSPAFFGSYRLLRSALISLLITVVSSFIFVGAYYGIGTAAGLDFNSAFDAIYKAYMAQDVSALTEAMNAEPLLSLISWTSIFESSVFAFSFWMHIMRYSTLTYFRSMTIGKGDPREGLFMYRVVLRSKKTKGYNKDYILAMLPIILFSLLGLGLGIFIGYKLTDIEKISEFFYYSSYFYAQSFVALCGILMMGIFIAFTIPYYFDCIYLIMDKYSPMFQEASMEFANEQMKNIQKNLEKYSPEEREEIEKALSELKKKQEEQDKVVDEKHDEDNKEDPKE